MTGAQLKTFITSLNAEAAIDGTLLSVLVSTAKATIEAERDWMVLRKTDSSLTLTTANTWQTAKSLSGITDFSHFYGERPITLFDGSNLTHSFVQVPFDSRLEHRNNSGTFVHDDNGNAVYFNGLIPFSGTLHSNYIAATGDIDLDNEQDQIWSPFPARFHPLLGFYAVGIFKGAVDYDQINKLMLPHNAAAMQALKNALATWDDKRQSSALDPDPSGNSYPRFGAVNRNA